MWWLAWLWLVTSRLVTGQGHMKQRPVVRAGLEGWRRPGHHRTTRHQARPALTLNTQTQTPTTTVRLRWGEVRVWGCEVREGPTSQYLYPSLVLPGWPGSVRGRGGGRRSGPSQDILIVVEWTGVSPHQPNDSPTRVMGRLRDWDIHTNTNNNSYSNNRYCCHTFLYNKLYTVTVCISEQNKLDTTYHAVQCLFRALILYILSSLSFPSFSSWLMWLLDYCYEYFCLEKNWDHLILSSLLSTTNGSSHHFIIFLQHEI